MHQLRASTASTSHCRASDMGHETSSADISFAGITSASLSVDQSPSSSFCSSSSYETDDEDMESDRPHRPFRSRRKGHGPSTGLRAVTMLVVHLLRQKSALSYEEIANDVCNQLRTSNEISEARNIRRRAYDVINVMAAVGYIKKHKKRLFSVQSFVDANGAISMDILMKEKTDRIQRIAEKEARIQCVLQQSFDRQVEHQRRQQQKQNQVKSLSVVCVWHQVTCSMSLTAGKSAATRTT